MREMMLMMGLSQWVLWSTWYLKQFVFLFISVIIMTLMLKVQYRGVREDGALRVCVGVSVGVICIHVCACVHDLCEHQCGYMDIDCVVLLYHPYVCQYAVWSGVSCE